jgi:uncharacterized peroxidase-related enzyme
MISDKRISEASIKRCGVGGPSTDEPANRHERHSRQKWIMADSCFRRANSAHFDLMAHIELPANEPGIIGLLVAYRDTERPLNDLANILMTGPSPLSRAERELIATCVSAGNQCRFCTCSHAAAARNLYRDQAEIVDKAMQDPTSANLTDKMSALIAIADKVRRDGRLVTQADIERARHAGADDRAIHDTVLIAAMFCMFNRYVDGLATWTPDDPEAYRSIGARIAEKGYGSRFQR